MRACESWLSNLGLGRRSLEILAYDYSLLILRLQAPG